MVCKSPRSHKAVYFSCNAYIGFSLPGGWLCLPAGVLRSFVAPSSLPCFARLRALRYKSIPGHRVSRAIRNSPLFRCLPPPQRSLHSHTLAVCGVKGFTSAGEPRHPMTPRPASGVYRLPGAFPVKLSVCKKSPLFGVFRLKVWKNATFSQQFK